MIGGMSERKTLRLVAQYADACNLFAFPGAATIRHKIDVLQGHWEDVGRPYEEIERTALGTINIAEGGMTAEEVIEQCRELNDAGVQHLIFNMPNLHEIRPLQIFGKKVIPAVADL